MAPEGWIKKHRSSLDTPELCTFLRQGVWDYLLLRAAHKPSTVVFRGQPVQLDRGELAVSVNALASERGVGRHQLRNILDSFVRAGMIEMGQVRGQAFSRISIINFNRFQSTQEETGPGLGTSQGQLGANSGPREQESKESKESNHTGNGSAEYAFHGAIIRLNQKDFDAWAEAYYALDLRAELQALDDFYDRNLKGAERSKWFQRCSAALAKKHERALAQGSVKRRRRQTDDVIKDLYSAGDDES